MVKNIGCKQHLEISPNLFNLTDEISKISLIVPLRDPQRIATTRHLDPNRNPMPHTEFTHEANNTLISNTGASEIGPSQYTNIKVISSRPKLTKATRGSDIKQNIKPWIIQLKNSPANKDNPHYLFPSSKSK